MDERISESRFFYLILIIFFLPFLLGTRACQEDVDFAAQTSGSVAATASASDDPDAVESATPSSSDTASESPSESASESASEDASGEPDAETVSTSVSDLGETLINSLLALRDGTTSAGVKKSKSVAQSSASTAAASNSAGLKGNWLGGQFKDESGLSADSDGDGFSDSLELENNSDPEDARSIPAIRITSRLAMRFQGVDDDLDGLSNSKEREIGTNLSLGDSDVDNASDGAELLSKTDPLDSKSKPKDRDNDGLDNDFESDAGTDPDNADTDRDGVKDDVEFAIGSSPLDNDTDKDGILDGKELQLGADPTVAEFN